LSFLGEIKRRKVWQVAAVYVAVALAVIGLIDGVNEPLSLPSWFDTVVIVLLAVGFPIALVLAWAFDLTPAGVVRTPPSEAETESEVPLGTRGESPPSEQVAPSPSTESVAPRPELLRNSVAVLPLENLSPNPDDAYFAAGIHGEILNYLAKIKDLHVIARTSVKRYQDTDKSIAEIAAELGVGTIMEGSVRYAGERVRVTAQLIDATTENHLWSEVYERDLADVFAIQADVAGKIAEALAAECSVAEKASMEKLPTSSPEAYALYLRALAIFQEHGHAVGASPGLRSSSRSYLDKAIAIDADFALAYVERARLYASQLNQDPGIRENYASSRAELEGLALADLRKALALDPGIGAAHGILARIHQFNWRGSEAREAYERALQLSPNQPEVLVDYAVFCAHTGRAEEALELGKRGVTVDPNSAEGRMWLQVVLLILGDSDAALAEMRRAVELSPTSGPAHLMLASQEGVLGNNAEARKHTQIAEQLLGDNINPAWVGEMLFSYAQAGCPEDAQRIFHRLEEMAETRRIPNSAWILGYLALGDDEQALHWLNAAADSPEPYVGYFGLMRIKLNAMASPVLDEPRFRKARDRLGFRD
jgi:TolB-like protein/Tfp pilus assembly protein PilF